METLYPVFLFAIAALTACGVLCEHFEDNLLQRIGMSSVCMAAVLRLYAEFVHLSDITDERSRLLLSIGVLCYAVGTVLDVHRKYRRLRKRINQQG